MPRVLFVSKPIEAPFHDGSKCFVRDVAKNLKSFTPTVMTTPRGVDRTAADVAPHVQAISAYSAPGGFAPSVLQNLRAIGSLLTHRQADLWHFVFAPNPRASTAVSWVRRLRKVPAVQTVASAPRRFEQMGQLLFGDVVVAQSEWTREQLSQACEREGVARDIRVVPPPLGPVALPTQEVTAEVCRRLELPESADIFVYSGDLEVSSGAATFAALTAPLKSKWPNAAFVFACRAKTPLAAHAQAKLQAQVDPAYVRFCGELPSLPALYQLATAVVFPVDDLWGKVDIPIAVLEAMALGVPTFCLGQGPLRDLRGVCSVPTLDVGEWVDALLTLRDSAAVKAQQAAQREHVLRVHDAPVVAAAYERIYQELLSARRPA